MSEISRTPDQPILGSPFQGKQRFFAFALACLILSICYERPLVELAHFSFSSELYSHILLVPFISAYLTWLKRHKLVRVSKPDKRAFSIFATSGAVVLTCARFNGRTDASFSIDDALALTILSFLLFFAAACSWFWGRQNLRSIAFPISFLFLMVPLPSSLVSWFGTFLQNQSALVALVLFRIARTPVYFHELVFQLPGISLEVAPQCSGIHSSVVLFITSLLAGHLFLKSIPKCCILAAAVIPLAIIRNGFRVFTIGELCVHIGPEMIDSPIHHRGGPFFFALSLVPLIIFLYYLMKTERRIGSASLNAQ
jgi:exosortase C (VPDSG-CTERM-specific)